jgi:hypothetical protein
MESVLLFTFGIFSQNLDPEIAVHERIFVLVLRFTAELNFFPREIVIRFGLKIYRDASEFVVVEAVDEVWVLGRWRLSQLALVWRLRSILGVRRDRQKDQREHNCHPEKL